MRKILSFGLALAVLSALSALSSPVLAVDKCHIPPPSWWNAPKVTNVYDGSSRAPRSYASYSSATTSHTFSAQRRNPAPSFFSAPRYRDPFRRW